MVQKKNPLMDTEQKWGLFYFSLFVIFVFAGIFVKRVLGHPELMMLFHLPAAVFLVFSGKGISAKMRRQYLENAAQEKL